MTLSAILNGRTPLPSDAKISVSSLLNSVLPSPKTIFFPNGHMTIESALPVSDVPFSYKIPSIEVYTSLSSSQSILIKLSQP